MDAKRKALSPPSLRRLSLLLEKPDISAGTPTDGHHARSGELVPMVARRDRGCHRCHTHGASQTAPIDARGNSRRTPLREGLVSLAPAGVQVPHAAPGTPGAHPYARVRYAPAEVMEKSPRPPRGKASGGGLGPSATSGIRDRTRDWWNQIKRESRGCTLESARGHQGRVQRRTDAPLGDLGALVTQLR
jgi:hypothetical protein